MKEKVVFLAIAAMLTVTASGGWAQEIEEEVQDLEEDSTSSELEFGGPFSERLKLTGDWGGHREQLALRGMTFDLDVTHITQWIVDGGFDGPSPWPAYFPHPDGLLWSTGLGFGGETPCRGSGRCPA